jgi:hypothetical protein
MSIQRWGLEERSSPPSTNSLRRKRLAVQDGCQPALETPIVQHAGDSRGSACSPKTPRRSSSIAKRAPSRSVLDVALEHTVTPASNFSRRGSRQSAFGLAERRSHTCDQVR